MLNSSLAQTAARVRRYLRKGNGDEEKVRKRATTPINGRSRPLNARTPDNGPLYASDVQNGLDSGEMEL